MILAALALASAQVTVPSAAGMSVDERIAALARREAAGSGRIESAIFDDAAMRAEVRRVGFASGCSIVGDIGRQVAARHAAALEPGIARAIRNVIPAQRMAEARAISFLVGPLTSYQGRVSAEVERTGGEQLARARNDMRRTFLARSRPLPTAADPNANRVAPRPDVAAALGHRGNWNLDDPAQMRFACMEQRISPQVRPRITTGGGGG
jgi:hypothetical protein